MPVFRHLRRLGTSLLLLAIAAPGLGQQTRIENTATLGYRTPSGEAVSVRSNTVTTDLVRAKRATTLSFRTLPPGVPLTGLACESTPDLVGTGAPIDAATLATARPMDKLDVREPVIMVLDDATGNRDPSVREIALVDAQAGRKHETVRLTETAPDSGVFAGAFPEEGKAKGVEATPCDFVLERGESVTLRIAEDDDSFGSAASILVDPSGYVFDSSTGELVDGAQVTLLGADGNPAAVYSEDGVTRYPSTVVSGAPVTDAEGRVYAGQPGRYLFPLVAPGRYQLRIVPPARYTAPSVRTPADLAILGQQTGQTFVINVASYGQAFEVVRDVDFIADVPLDPAQDGTLLLTKTASVRQASPGDVIEYRLEVQNRGAAALTGLHAVDQLPAGLRYRPGSTRGAPEPALAGDGRSFDLTLPSVAAGSTLEVRYLATVAPDAPVGEALNHARVAGQGFASNEAAAAVRLQPLLFTDAFTVIGRVTEGNCGDPARGRRGIPGIRLLLEDGTYTVTDRDGLYHFEGVRPGRHVVQLDAGTIPASHESVACDADTRQAGSAISRFTEGQGGLLRRVDFQLSPTGRAAAAVPALPVAAADDGYAAGQRDWLAGQAPGIAWLFPETDHNPRTPALRVAIKHRPGQRVALAIDGRPVDPLAYDATDTAGEVAVSRWSGIPLGHGANRLTARVLEADGRLAATLERVVHVAGAAARAVLDPRHSRLVADGRTQPILAVRLTDREGRPVRAGALVPFAVAAPYRAAEDAALEQGRQLAGRERTSATARVIGDDGVALVALQPTTQAGAVRLRLTMADDRQVRTADLRAWLAPAVRDWTVVGFGAGTLGYDTLRRHAADLPRGDHRVTTDGQLALYAKGRIKGEWLLTLAYDSKRAYDPDRGLLGVIDPDRYYTVYGDGSAQGYDAPTRRKLYLRLERRAAFALFGDFETGLNDTVLARYSRTVNGVKAGFEGSRLRATGFAADTDTRHRRDEIQGNGLSGPYRLSARQIVPNSDKLYLEVRDRLRSDRIVSQTAMTRHIDYDIDPALGTIRFRSPVLGRDAALNPVFIVVDYEVDGGAGGQLVAGGRVAARTAGDAVEIGVSVLRDDTAGHATLVAADLQAHLDAGTELRGEIAAGGRGGLGAGRAFVAEAEHHDARLDLLGYVRQQDNGFGVGQQNAVEAGTRKAGIEGRLRLTDRLSLAGTAWHQDVLDEGGTRDAADLRLELRRAAGTVFVGAQLASDRGRDGHDRDSRLLTLGGSQALLGGALTLTGQTQLAPGGDKASVDFPVRHQLDAALRVAPGVRLLGGYEIADGDGFVAHTARVGFDLAPWAGARLTSTLNQQAMGENGSRTFAQYGLSQSLPLGPRWTLDATLDAAGTVRGAIDPGALTTLRHPAAAGGFIGSGEAGAGEGAGTEDDYTAVTLGATYRAPRWSANGRVEHRRADTGTRWGLTADLLRSLGQGRTLAAGLKAYTLRDPAGAVATYAAGDLALALRPLDSRWSLLERVELRHERADAGISAGNMLGVPAFAAGDQLTTRAVNNVAVNYRTGAEGQGHGLEATVYYGAKYIAGRFEEERYDGFIHLVGFELRRDVGRRFDLGIQGSVQHAWSARAVSWSGGPSAGVSPAADLWITAGYNLAGYRDRDAPDGRYTRAGPYLTMRLKFDQRSVAGATHALFGRSN